MIMHADDNIQSFLSKRCLVFYLAEASPMLSLVDFQSSAGSTPSQLVRATVILLLD